MSRGPQKTRCLEWIGYWTKQCGRPLTHRVVGRWKNFPGQPERVLMCEKHARRFVAGNSPLSSAVFSAYRCRR